MRSNVTFKSKGLNCSAFLYIPDTWKEGEKLPAIVMAPGFSGVKEMSLPEYADKFAEAGFVTLLFDYRTFGESEGEPRQQLFPLEHPLFTNFPFREVYAGRLVLHHLR